jgi:ferredoxin-type protein NapH
MKNAKLLLIFSIISRAIVILLLCSLALLTQYHNLKLSYNNSGVVELSDGKVTRYAYDLVDRFFKSVGDPVEEARRYAGMTWSIRIMGVPFTDPIAALSVFVKSYHWELGFALGLIVPLSLAFTFGRVFCAYICPASLLFFSISRIRKLLERFFYFPSVTLNRGFCWGILIGGLILAVWMGHGIWMLILPYFALGQTLFSGIAFGTISSSLGSLTVFALLDLLMGKQFTCRYICPTGRLLGFIGQKSLYSIKREKPKCIDACTSCIDVCPMKVSPKFDETVDCSMCGECISICPGKCLSIGLRNKSQK